MRNYFKRTGPGQKLLLKAILLTLTSAISLPQVAAQSPNQSPPEPYWQTEAGGKMAFDVATVRENKTAPRNPWGSNFPLGPGDVYNPNGGQFTASNFPLLTYIVFAYKIADNQEQSLVSQLPKWAHSTSL
jgi:hypothetical protein